MKDLSIALEKFPQEERSEILRDFEEHFTLGLEEGKTEEQIAKSLGSPNHIAKEMYTTYRIEQVEGKATAGNILRAVWAVIGLGFFNVVIVLGPFIGLVSIVLAGWVVGVTFIATPILVLLKIIVAPETFIFFDLFFSVLIAGLGILVTIGMYHGTKLFRNGLVRYLKFNAKLVKGGMAHA
ncbi:Uncharacterized membrane protein [Oceanobacillus limi]|uniref:Uncharacterized membrane protein n=2 Tax=Oceanobacillus limi TaxID=930131 RepID=A0A1I0B800_9BACI|nr:Uncharacterized membrane protein [Oceanobacillus limi]